MVPAANTSAIPTSRRNTEAVSAAIRYSVPPPTASCGERRRSRSSITITQQAANGMSERTCVE